MWRQLLVWSLLVSISFAETPTKNAEQADLLKRQRVWKEKLSQFPARFNTGRHEIALESLERFRSNLQVHLVYDPKMRGVYIFRFVDKDREIVSIRGHRYSSFCSKDDRLFFADYPPDNPGCTVIAFDLASGKEIWRTNLHQEQPLAASGYRNLAMITLPYGPHVPGDEREEPGAVVKISGSETYCDYIEVLDAKTGTSLAIRNYRVGFGGLQTAPESLGEKEKNNASNNERTEKKSVIPRLGF